VRKGVDEVELSGRLNGKPAIIVHGRSDALVPVNHSSRAYLGKTHLVDAHGNRNLRYVEVTNAQHFDAFLPGGAIFGGYENRYVPLHVYFIRAMDWMYEHLSNGKPLPPSQVVRTLPRGGTPGTAPALGDANVPEILDNPAAGERITFDRSTLYIPD
jgi:hydroxybutyrate-dimer hydrolase